MKSLILKLVCCLSLAMTAVLNGCGGGAPQEQQLPADSTVFGTLASSSGSPLMVSLKDSASPPGVHQTTPDADGAYSFDTNGLHAPYLLIGEVSAGANSVKLYSVAATNGRTDITAATTQEFEANHADGGSRDGGSSDDENEGDHHVLTRAELLTRLQTVLAPLFSEFHVSFPLTQSENFALHALFMAVHFSVDDGAVLVTNRQTRKTIFTGKLSNLAAGIFTPANMPVPGGTNACTYTYSAWGSCQSNGMQSRTVVTSTPAGCTGTTVLSQSCTPPVTNPVTFAGVVSACTSCHGLTSNTTVFKAGGYTVSGRSAAGWLSTVNNMVGIGSGLPPGATAQQTADYLAGVH